MTAVSLRDVIEDDLAIFFAQEQDPDAREIAEFTTTRPTERAASDARWRRVLADSSKKVKTVMLGDDVVGYVGAFERLGQSEVAYWIGREFWGQSIATKALKLLLQEITERPIYARAVVGHTASMRVLEKCGFETYAREKFFSESRDKEMEEWVFVLT